MAKTAEYLKSLVETRSSLAENLRNKGISAADDEKLNSLVPKVLDIIGERKVLYGEWINITNSESFVIENIPFRPARIAISCESVLQNQVTSTKDSIFIALLSADGIAETEASYQLQDGQLTHSADNTGADISVAENNGVYSVTLSFASTNETASVPIYFKSGFVHSWVASSDEWEV